MKKIIFVIACIICTSSAIFAAKSDCGEHAQSYHDLMEMDKEYLGQWEGLCNQYASTLLGDDRFFWLQYKDSELWNDFVVSYSSSFCNNKYFSAKDRTIISEFEKLSQNLGDDEVNKILLSKLDNYLLAYLSWKQNRTGEDRSLDDMPRVGCDKEYRKAIEKIAWWGLGFLGNDFNVSAENEVEAQAFFTEIFILACQAAKVGQETVELLSELGIVQKHLEQLLDDLFADKKGIEKNFATIFSKYKKQAKLDPIYRNEDLLLTYEDLLLQVLTLNGGNSLFKTYSENLQQRLSASRLLTSINHEGAKADKVRAMSDEYFNNQALKDFANAIAPYFKGHISKEDLLFVKDTIFSDKLYRTITDSVLFLSNNAMIYDANTGTMIYNVDSANHDYWELRTELKLLVGQYNMYLTFGGMEKADSLVQYMDPAGMKKVEDEWLYAYIMYTVPELSEQMRPFFNLSLAMACNINPRLKEDLTDEKYNNWYEQYCVMGAFLTLAEYRLVASNEDLQYLTELKETKQYKNYVKASANMLEKLAQWDESFWCTIATSMSDYMQANYKDSPAEVKLFKDGAEQICAALK